MKKKLIALLLAGTMIITSLVGCGKEPTNNKVDSEATKQEESTTKEESSEVAEVTSNFNEEGYPIVNEEITIKILMSLTDSLTIAPPEEMAIVQELEEKTGIKTEWEVVKSSDWATRFNLIMATGDYPDVIITRGSSNPVDWEEYGVGQKILLPLDELIEQYMPNYTERIALNDYDPTISLMASDGQKYAVGFMVPQNINTTGQPVINKTWLDALKLDMPKDIEGLTEVLRAFKTGDPNGNGEADEIPMTLTLGEMASMDHAGFMLPLFGLPYDGSRWIYIDDNKEVQFSPTKDGFRECMEWLHACYDEGILDVEAISQDAGMASTKAADGKLGFFSAWRMIASGWDDGAAKDCVLYVPEEADFYYQMELAEASVFVTSANENVEATMRWLNALLETETMFDFYCGKQNQEQDPTKPGWFYNENGKIEDCPKPADMKVREFLGNRGVFFATADYYFDIYEAPPARIEKTNWCNQYADAGLLQKYSNDHLMIAPLTTEQMKSKTLIETDVNNAVLEHMATFIKNGVTDSSWEKFVKIFEDMKISEYVQMYQDTINTMDIE